MRKKARPQSPPPRHPDPVVERELQRIRDLQQRSRSKAGQVDDYRSEIDRLHSSLRHINSETSSTSYESVRESGAVAATRVEQQIVRLMAEIRQLEQESDAIHDDIAARQDKLDPFDLAYL